MASSVLLTLYAVFIFLAYGTTAAVSRLVGAGDERAATGQAVQALWLALGIGVSVAVVGLLVAEPLVGVARSRGRGPHQRADLPAHQPARAARPDARRWPAPGYLRGAAGHPTPLVVAGTTLGNLVLEVRVDLRARQGASAPRRWRRCWPRRPGPRPTCGGSDGRPGRPASGCGPRPRRCDGLARVGRSTCWSGPPRCGPPCWSPPPWPRAWATSSWPPTRSPSRCGASSPWPSTPWPSPARRWSAGTWAPATPRAPGPPGGG